MIQNGKRYRLELSLVRDRNSTTGDSFSWVLFSLFPLYFLCLFPLLPNPSAPRHFMLRSLVRVPLINDGASPCPPFSHFLLVDSPASRFWHPRYIRFPALRYLRNNHDCTYDHFLAAGQHILHTNIRSIHISTRLYGSQLLPRVRLLHRRRSDRRSRTIPR